MAKNFKLLSAALNADPQRRARVEAHKRAIRDALSLAHLRRSRGATQQSLAAALGISQPNVSRVEHQDDLYLSSLAGYVEALGGRLEIMAVFPDERIGLGTGGILVPERLTPASAEDRLRRARGNRRGIKRDVRSSD